MASSPQSNQFGDALIRGREESEYETQLDIAKFSSKQIRKLAQQCGIKGGGNMTLFKARRAIAQYLDMGTVYNDNTIANPRTTADERRCNTLLRLINTCFLPCFNLRHQFNK